MERLEKEAVNSVKNARKFSKVTSQNFSVKIDYLSFSLRVHPRCGVDLIGVVRSMLQANNHDVNQRLIFDERGGWNGYQASAGLKWLQSEGEKPVVKNIGLIAFGGDSQRGRVYVSFSGAGCDQVGEKGLEWLAHHFERLAVKLTRLDIALDDYDGKNSITSALKRYYRGQFGNGTAQPKLTSIRKGLDDFSGSTLYVGAIKSGKYCRIYEKGRQLGDPKSKWLRVEVQLGSHQRVLPKKILIDPLPFAFGAYPAALKKMFPSDTEFCSIKTIRVASQIDLTRACANLRKAAGATVSSLLAAGMHSKNILTILNRELSKTPKRLATSNIKGSISSLGLQCNGMSNRKSHRNLKDFIHHIDVIVRPPKKDDKALWNTDIDSLFRNAKTVTVTSGDVVGVCNGT